MNNFDFNGLFQELGIETESLPANYTPDDYAKKLINKYFRSDQLSYSSVTVLKQPDKSSEH